MTTQQEGDTYLLLRINQEWHDGISAADLYEATRGWWVMSSARADYVSKVFAVALGVIRAVYVPASWSNSQHPGEEHRIGFEGALSSDSSHWVGTDVSVLFTKGSANPVLYVEPELFRSRFGAPPEDEDAPQDARLVASEPTLEEGIEPLLRELDEDLLWSMSRASQELFHSNTLAFLMEKYAHAALPVRQLFDPNSTGEVTIHREYRHLDLVGEGPATRFVVENKLYSLPYPEQLKLYLAKDLPWSSGHGPVGATDARYTLLSLMHPTFDPAPWHLVTYEQLADVLDRFDLAEFGRDADLLGRYRALVRRLIDLKDIVDPSRNLNDPFTVSHMLGKMHLKWFDGPLQRMRFTGLGQAVHRQLDEPSGEFGVDLRNARGILSYRRPLRQTVSIGWQLQGDALRLVLWLNSPELKGKGDTKKLERAMHAEERWLDWFDFGHAEDVLGPLLHARSFQAGEWNHFDPDFVYRWRRVDPATTSSQLIDALVALCRRSDTWTMGGR